MTDHYNKETVDVKFDNICETLERIETQCIKTNGRVSALEKWRWLITGILLALGALNIPNLSVIAKLFTGL